MIIKKWFGAKGAEEQVSIDGEQLKKPPLAKRVFFWYRLSITTKTAIVFGFSLFVILAIFATLMLVGIAGTIASGALVATDNFSYITTFGVAFVVVAILAVLATALGALASSLMLRPIRKMIDKLDDITESNLDVRLDDVDRQNELRELTKRINGMLAMLEEAFDRQRNFVADAGHELKTPIAVLQGYAKLLKRWGTTKPDVLDESVEAIYRESFNMQRIIEQLSTLAGLAGANLRLSKFRIEDVLGEVVEGYKMLYGKHTFETNLKSTEDVEADMDLYVQVVRALIDNAVKYTQEGGTITVSCYYDTVFSTVVTNVEDTGMGISMEDSVRIFERFYRCDKARSRKDGSSGLGLAIAKSIVELHYGDIGVVSEEGKGSKFFVRLSAADEQE